MSDRMSDHFHPGDTGHEDRDPGGQNSGDPGATFIVEVDPGDLHFSDWSFSDLDGS